MCYDGMEEEYRKCGTEFETFRSNGLTGIVGIVDGTGSVGAALGQLIVPAIINSAPHSISLHYVFYFFILMVRNIRTRLRFSVLRI